MSSAAALVGSHAPHTATVAHLPCIIEWENPRSQGKIRPMVLIALDFPCRSMAWSGRFACDMQHIICG
jgi:hypothetical protein